MKNFKDKVIVITGAGSGMGRAYALAFAKTGSKLALCDVDADGLDETRKLAVEAGCQATIVSIVDMAEADQVSTFAEKVKDEVGCANVVINNAGIEGSAAPAWATSEACYKKVMAVNFYGVVNGTQAFLPQLKSNKESALVNISSIFGLVGTPNHTDYCASKFAVRGFTEALMAELKESHIQVHIVHPGGIATNIARSESSQVFNNHYLSTPPEAIAEFVIKCIKKKKYRIVYGNSAFRTWLGSKLLSLELLSFMCWHEMKKIIDRKHY